MHLLVVSICRNEAETVQKLINGIPRQIPGVSKVSVLIIDDGSTDNTAEIARKAGADVLSDGAGKGLAYRFREAVDYALGKAVDVMANIDGDLQFDPKDIPKLIEPVVAGRADFVAADRFTDPETGVFRRPKNMPFAKYHGNKLGARIVSHLSNAKFRDVTCGFRAYNQRALIALNTNGTYTYTQESFQVLAAKRLRIETMPVVVRYFPGRKSRVVTSIPKFVATSALNILRAFRDFAPLRFFMVLGAVPMVLGLICVGFVGVHYFQTGMFSPYKFVGFAGVYLVSVGIFVWGIGLVADMLARVLNNQEKIYEHLRRERVNKN